MARPVPPPSRGFQDETPLRVPPVLPFSRAARTWSRARDRVIQPRPARRRRETPNNQVRCPRRRCERTRAGYPTHRNPGPFRHEYTATETSFHSAEGLTSSMCHAFGMRSGGSEANISVPFSTNFRGPTLNQLDEINRH